MSTHRGMCFLLLAAVRLSVRLSTGCPASRSTLIQDPQLIQDYHDSRHLLRLTQPLLFLLIFPLLLYLESKQLDPRRSLELPATDGDTFLCSTIASIALGQTTDALNNTHKVHSSLCFHTHHAVLTTTTMHFPFSSPSHQHPLQESSWVNTSDFSSEEYSFAFQLNVGQ